MFAEIDKDELIKDFIKNPYVFTLCATELATRMSLQTSPLRGGVGSDNKAYLASVMLKSMASKLMNSSPEEQEYQEASETVHELYTSFIKRTKHQGEELVWEGEDGIEGLDDKYAVNTASYDAVMQKTKRNPEPEEDELEEEEDEEDSYDPDEG